MIGERVAEARKRLGITQSELARRAGLTPAGVWQIEKEMRTPNGETLKSLSGVLGVTADWLLGGEGEPAALDPELQAMFRGLGNLSARDRETLLRVYENMKKEDRDG